jgi:hypothetical protein
MSIKNLFKDNGNVISKKSLSDLTSSFGLESYGVISSSYNKYNLLPPNIDFSKPSNFAKYGSAEHYYDASIKKICNTYPYDGSKKQKLEWRNNASYLDLHLFDNEYPKYTGSIDIGYDFGTVTDLGAGIYYTSRVEYLFIPKGLGLNTIYDEDSDKTSSFSFNKDSGFCFEFWFKKNANVATNGISTILHCQNNIEYGNSGHFSLLVYSSNNDLSIGLYNNSSIFGHTLDNEIEIDEWNHFSINVFTSTFPKIEIWKNNSKKLSEELTYGIYPNSTVDTSMSGTFGASMNSGLGVSLGYQKISGSFDDVRFWRRKRTDSEILKNWFTTIDGGFDSDELLNPDMGFYYKFNEKLYGTASLDSIVLDYSGRKNNAKWIGYTYGNRNPTSPISFKKGDVITNFSSSDVYTFYTDKINKGIEHDRNNNGCIINNLPEILKKDNEHYKNLTQIISSIFDSLFLEIQSLSNIKDNSVFVSGSLPSDVLLRLINSNGLDINNILDNYSLSEIIESKNEQFVFEKDIEKIKQVIYKNIYNSLTDIYKAKGTEKAIKSIFRSFGVDDDVLKIKSYTKEGSIEIDGTKRIDTVRRKNLLDLFGNTDEQNMNGTLYLQYCNDITGSTNFLSHSFTPNVISHVYNAEKTFEANILFPLKYGLNHKNHIYLNENDLSASLFGFVQIKDDIAYNSPNSTWATNPNYVNVFIVQKDRYGKDAKFVLEFSGTNYTPIYTQTDWIENVYDNTKWTVAVKLNSSNKYSDEYNTSGIYTTSLSFIGIHEESGRILNSFSSTFDLNYVGSSVHNNILSCKIKPYVGALRTNFSGTVLCPTQARFYSFRVWRDNLSDQNIIDHSYDVHNFGIENSYENSFSLKDSIISTNYNRYIPKNELLLINWDFEGESYIPNNNGIFTVSSFRSSSFYSDSNNIYQNIQYNFAGVGVGFNSDSEVIDKNYAIESKNRVPTDYHSYDDISLLDDEDKYFGKKIKPIEYFYTIENSIYSVISEDILNMFSSISDFNNLFGMTHEKYRIQYKLLRLFRKLFFGKVRNDKIDISKYFSYYKWLDSAIETIAKSLFPFSANADSNVRNVIESHVLERPKHTFTPEILRSKPKFNLIFNVKSSLNSKILNQLPISGINNNQEMHYLQFPGISEYMYIQNGMTGYTPSTGKYTILMKFYDRPSTHPTWPTLFMLNDSTVDVYPKNATEWSQIGNNSPPGVHRHIGITTAGSLSIARVSTASFVNDRNLHMLSRDLTTNTAKIEIFTPGSIYWNPSDVAAVPDSAPTDIAIGTRISPNLSPTTGSSEGSYSNLKWISTVVFTDYNPIEQDVLDYSDLSCTDARLIWPTEITRYWTATNLLGNGSGPLPPTVGNINAILVGLDEDDLTEM